MCPELMEIRDEQLKFKLRPKLLKHLIKTVSKPFLGTLLFCHILSMKSFMIYLALRVNQIVNNAACWLPAVDVLTVRSHSDPVTSWLQIIHQSSAAPAAVIFIQRELNILFQVPKIVWEQKEMERNKDWKLLWFGCKIH